MTSETTFSLPFPSTPIPSYYTMFSQFTIHFFFSYCPLLPSSISPSLPLYTPALPSTLSREHQPQMLLPQQTHTLHALRDTPYPLANTHTRQTKPECYTAQLDQCNVHGQKPKFHMQAKPTSYLLWNTAQPAAQYLSCWSSGQAPHPLSKLTTVRQFSDWSTKGSML